jgi:hypothetical protein
MLPAAIKEPLAKHFDLVKRQHQRDLERGLVRVALPNALERKYPNAGKEWGWHWVFPATSHYTDRVTGEKRRHHLHESVLYYRRRSRKASDSLGSSSPPAPIRFAIRSRLTCWRMAMTSGPCKNSWATEM